MTYTWNRRTPASFQARTETTYDTKCYDLAAEFLQDEPGLFTEKLNVELAKEIQETIEAFLTNARDNYDGGQP